MLFTAPFLKTDHSLFAAIFGGLIPVHSQNSAMFGHSIPYRMGVNIWNTVCVLTPPLPLILMHCTDRDYVWLWLNAQVKNDENEAKYT